MRVSHRSLVFVALLAMAAMIFAACAAPVAAPAAPAAESDTAGEAAAGEAMAPADFQIGLVTDVGRINDRSFNQSAWDGVVQAARGDGSVGGQHQVY